MATATVLLWRNRTSVSSLRHHVNSSSSHVYHQYPSSAAAFSTKPPPAFFTFNSGRSRRRRKQRNLVQRQREQAAAAAREKPTIDSSSTTSNHNHPEQDNRTVRDILFPRPHYSDAQANEDKFIWPTSTALWKSQLAHTWEMYRQTWEGFFSSRGFIVQKKNDNDVQLDSKELKLAAESKKDEISANVQRNVDFVKKESTKLRDEVRERTGIHTTEDLRQVAGDMMKLASACLKEFMSGYRKGRDDETEKMLTEYFQELEEKVNKPKRRKPKRRVLTP